MLEHQLHLMLTYNPFTGEFQIEIISPSAQFSNYEAYQHMSTQNPFELLRAIIQQQDLPKE